MHYRLLIILLNSTLLGCVGHQQLPQNILDVHKDIKHKLSIIEPDTHNPLTWDEFIKSLSSADVILLGEQHDHVVGHALQLEIVSEIMEHFRGSTLALEMLERDEQHVVDDYIDNLITSETLAKLTRSQNWSGDGTWAAWYQPIVSRVKELGGNILAANAPRRYARLARIDGFEAIDLLPEERRAYVEYPKELSGGIYRERFWDLAAHDVDEESMLSFYRGQQVWDATMASSIANAKPSQQQKVLLLVGQFHVEFMGGVVQELHRRLPHALVKVITIHRKFPEEGWDGEPPIADVLIVDDK